MGRYRAVSHVADEDHSQKYAILFSYVNLLNFVEVICWDFELIDIWESTRPPKIAILGFFFFGLVRSLNRFCIYSFEDFIWGLNSF